MTVYQQCELTEGKPALVLLHGWGMQSDVWLPLQAQLAEHFSLYMPDLPGLGRSSALEQGYSFHEMAEAILAQVPERAHWLGWSLGGTLATYIAAYHPERVNTLITVASNPCYVARDNWSCAMDSTVFEQFSHALKHNPLKTLQRFIMLQTQGSVLARETLRALKQQQESYKTRIPEGLSDTLALLAEDQRCLVSKTKCPWLAIWGEVDQLVPVDICQQMSELNDQIRHCVYQQCGHVPFYAQPDRFVTDIIEFSGQTT